MFLEEKDFKERMIVDCVVSWGDVKQFVSYGMLIRNKFNKWVILHNNSFVGNPIRLYDILYCNYGYKRGKFVDKNVFSIKEIKMKKEFTKDDLKSGMIVELKNGRRILIFDCSGKIMGLLSCYEDGYYDFSSFNNDLTNKNEKIKDIVKIYKMKPYEIRYVNFDKNNFEWAERCDVIWERQPEKTKLTVAQIEEKLGYPVEVVRG